MSDKDTSTLQSYIDSAAGAAQSLLGSVTGSTADKAQGEQKQEEAQLKHDASQATAKLPGYSASSSGAITQDDPRRQQGSWDQTIGSGKEALGNLIGAEGLKKQGREQNLQGQGLEAQGQLADLSGGVADRAKGAIGGAVAGLTGDEKGKAEYQELHDKGKSQQRGAEYDINKQAGS